MLFGVSTIENKGDSAISVGEVNVIRKLGIELVFHCEDGYCHTDLNMDRARKISSYFNTSELIILMHGGGNILSYRYEDAVRQIVLEAFPDHKVVVFSQSIWPILNEEKTKKYQHAYTQHKHLTMLYRDRPSYNLGKKLFQGVECYLMPDMAFHIGAVKRFISPLYDIVWLQRNDTESPKYDIPSNTHGYSVIVEDWVTWESPKEHSPLGKSYIITINGMMFLQRGKVVITDRLHGHVLSVLCGIPHVLIDPVNKKTSSYMRSWTGGLDDALVASSSEDALTKAVKLLRNLDHTIPEKSFTQ